MKEDTFLNQNKNVKLLNIKLIIFCLIFFKQDKFYYLREEAKIIYNK
jgi:hypothetical protein